MAVTIRKSRKPRKDAATRSQNNATKTPARRREASAAEAAGLVARGSPAEFRVRVRMYRQGLGDCFLLTFPRQGQAPFNMLIDCGALARDSAFMTRIVEHIRDTVRSESSAIKARLDVVVATHEHKDHVSGFNQARTVFNNDLDIGAVWLAWTENLTEPEIRTIKETRKKAFAALKAVADSPLAVGSEPLQGLSAILGFSDDDDSTGSHKVAEAMEYLKLRGKQAGALKFLEPGGAPLGLEGVDGVHVYVLGPPRDPSALKTSAITEQMKRDDVVYRISGASAVGIEALAAAGSVLPAGNPDRFQPFAVGHRITLPDKRDGHDTPNPTPNFKDIMGGAAAAYAAPKNVWRRIDDDWTDAFGQLALDLDSDTNNTSLVLAFEFIETSEVLLFVGDAQVGSWLSWANLEFDAPNRRNPLPALDLLRRTVFYKVGHHCSHNATLKVGGLELMTSENLVAFIPLDRDTASKQGKRGWEMPAPPLFSALEERASHRVVISDEKEALSKEAKSAGIMSTPVFVDYFLNGEHDHQS